MKKIILIIGILIGLTIGVSSQNDAKPLTEEDAEEISMMTNGVLSPEDIKTAVNNSHTVILRVNTLVCVLTRLTNYIIRRGRP